MSSEAGDEQVLELEEKLTRCLLERDRLRAEKESLMIMKRELAQLEDLFTNDNEAGKLQDLVFREQKQPLQQAVKAKWQSACQVEEALDEIQANHDRKKAQVLKADEELKVLYAGLKEKDEICRKESEELDKLQSRIDEQWKDLIAFLQTCRENSQVTDAMQPLLQYHYDAYINTLQCGDDDYRMLNEYVRFLLQPSSAQNQNHMSAGFDFISPVSTAISKVLNSSLFSKMNLTDRDPKDKHLVGDRMDNESEDPGEASIGKKLWDFIIT